MQPRKIKMLLQSLFASYRKGTDFPAQETEKVKAVSSIITFSQSKYPPLKWGLYFAH